MKTTLFALVGACALLALATTGGAHPTATEVPCPVLGSGTCYLYTNDTATPEVWEETNDLEGLQRGPTEGPNGDTIPADTQIA